MGNEKRPELSRCSRCKKSKLIECFKSMRPDLDCILKTCTECRQPNTLKRIHSKAYRDRKKAQGIRYDTRGKDRNEYMRNYQRKRRELKKNLINGIN